MDVDKPNIVVTGISGGLGLRLLPQLGAYSVTGIDLNPPSTSHPIRFVRLDLGLEESCRELFLLLRELRPVALIHLAFVMDPLRADIVDSDRMWQINVGGTARVMEALTEVNRDEEIVKQFIFLSCVAAYGPNHPGPAAEESKLAARTLPFAIHKMEADQTVQQRAPSARDCSVYVLRSAVFAGARISNHTLAAFRGLPTGTGKYAAQLRRHGRRIPFILPWGAEHLLRQIQFVHVEDVGRLILYILRKSEPEARRLTVLNISGRGEPLTLQRCIDMAHSKLMKVPGEWSMMQALRFLWRMQISEIPPEATSYLLGGQVMNLDRLREFLGPYYQEVIQYTVSDSFAECFAPDPNISSHISSLE